MKRMALKACITPLLCCVLHSARAQSGALIHAEGQWVLNLGKQTFMLLTLKPTGNSAHPFTGTFSLPLHFQTSDAVSFSHISGDVNTERIVACEWKNTSLAITVENPSDPSDKDDLLLSLKDDQHALLQYIGVPLPPINLLRWNQPISVSTGWDTNKTYSPDDDLPSNPEMKRIFDEDQAVRQPGSKIDWSSVGKSDAERRQATLKLLNAGALHSGEDFTWAAFLFQHGSGPNDYLFAHTLAMIALKKGYNDALWIATATLDRYLQAVKQPQIYGTQFLTPKGLPTTQDPYDRTLISDTLRHQLGVPSLAAQQDQLKYYDNERKK